jgi:hypothetical protein
MNLQGADLAEALNIEVPVKAQKIANDVGITPSFVKEIFNLRG